MNKRTVLSTLMLLVGGLLSLSVEGLALGLPLLLVGGYWAFGAHVPLDRLAPDALRV